VVFDMNLTGVYAIPTMLKLLRQTHSCMQASRYRRDENYGQAITSQGNEVCRDDVF